MLCQFLLYSKVNQPCIYTYPLYFGFPSHLGEHRALSTVTRAVQSVIISYLFVINHLRWCFHSLPKTQMVMNLPALQETWFDLWAWGIPWRREWLPTPVFLPGESHGQRSLVGYSPWGSKESDTTERLTLFQRHYVIHISPVLVHFTWQVSGYKVYVNQVFCRFNNIKQRWISSYFY